MILGVFEGFLFILFTCTMFWSQIYSICTDETVSVDIVSYIIYGTELHTLFRMFFWLKMKTTREQCMAVICLNMYCISCGEWMYLCKQVQNSLIWSEVSSHLHMCIHPVTRLTSPVKANELCRVLGKYWFFEKFLNGRQTTRVSYKPRSHTEL